MQTGVRQKRKGHPQDFATSFRWEFYGRKTDRRSAFSIAAGMASRACAKSTKNKKDWSNLDNFPETETWDHLMILLTWETHNLAKVCPTKKDGNLQLSTFPDRNAETWGSVTCASDQMARRWRNCPAKHGARPSNIFSFYNSSGSSLVLPHV